MNVVDSSAWLEYLADGPNADSFEPVIQDEAALVVPSITLFEVFKVTARQRGEREALRAAANMRRGLVVDLDADLALAAAKLSHDLKLPMADSIILATARAHDATLWTQDDDFSAIPGVRYFTK
jgi:predicted nucleic acid-binding protein